MGACKRCIKKSYSLELGCSLAKVRLLFSEKIIDKKMLTLTNNQDICQNNLKFGKKFGNVMKKFEIFLTLS